jgi:hypothetical protein
MCRKSTPSSSGSESAQLSSIKRVLSPRARTTGPSSKRSSRASSDAESDAESDASRSSRRSGSSSCSVSRKRRADEPANYAAAAAAPRTSFTRPLRATMAAARDDVRFACAQQGVVGSSEAALSRQLAWQMESFGGAPQVPCATCSTELPASTSCAALSDCAARYALHTTGLRRSGHDSSRTSL